MIYSLIDFLIESVMNATSKTITEYDNNNSKNYKTASTFPALSAVTCTNSNILVRYHHKNTKHQVSYH